MKAILDTAAEGIVIFDDHGQIESFNQAAEQIFGYKAQEIHGQKVDKLLATALPTSSRPSAPTSASDSVRMVAQVVRTRGEAQGRRKDGSVFPAEVAFSEVPLQGRKVITGRGALLRLVCEPWMVLTWKKMASPALPVQATPWSHVH